MKGDEEIVREVYDAMSKTWLAVLEAQKTTETGQWDEIEEWLRHTRAGLSRYVGMRYGR